MSQTAYTPLVKKYPPIFIFFISESADQMFNASLPGAFLSGTLKLPPILNVATLWPSTDLKMFIIFSPARANLRSKGQGDG
jgi:hypothetical protein